MDKETYKKLVAKLLPKEPRIRNAIIAFVVGGLLGLFSELTSTFLVLSFGIEVKTSYAIVCLLTIFLASLFTGLGFFDNWVKKYKCGLIVPTTGFAHSVASSAIEYRKDGLITGLGSNFFKLAGSVIVYGIISAFFLCLIKVVLLNV